MHPPSSLLSSFLFSVFACPLPFSFLLLPISPSRVSLLPPFLSFPYFPSSLTPQMLPNALLFFCGTLVDEGSEVYLVFPPEITRLICFELFTR
jgi:hypothetical protein